MANHAFVDRHGLDFVEEDRRRRSPVDEVFEILVLWKIDVCFQIDLV